MSSIPAVTSIAVESEPDCIKVYPYDNLSGLQHFSPYKGATIVSSYTYDSTSNQRKGQLLYFNPLCKQRDWNFGLIQCKTIVEDTGGILMCKWVKQCDDVYVVALSSSIKLLKFRAVLDEFSNDIRFSRENDIMCDHSDDSVGISFCECQGVFTVTSSTGYVYYIRDHSVTWKSKAHDFQVWTSTLNPLDTNCLYTGADDAFIKKFDVRCGTDPIETIKSHISGVTTLQFSPINPNFLYSGSFDDTLQLHDIRKASQPTTVINNGGSVWYIDFILAQTGQLQQVYIASCHDGSHLYNTGSDGFTFSLSQKMLQGEQLVYGTDHYTQNSHIIYTYTDFYNKKIYFTHYAP